VSCLLHGQCWNAPQFKHAKNRSDSHLPGEPTAQTLGPASSFLSDGPVVQLLDRFAVGQEVLASVAADSVKHLIDQQASEYRQDVGDVVQVQESDAVGWRGDGENPLTTMRIGILF
jgi:hypothetical protein